MMKTAAENLIALNRTANQLARPHTIRTRVSNAAGGVDVVNVSHEPLIATLRAAVYGGSGANGNQSSALPSDRTVLNPVALAHMDALREDILASMRLLIPNLFAIPADWTLEHALAYWIDLFLPAAADGQYDDDTIATATKLMADWRHTILSQFDTPQIMTSSKPCPKCDQTWAIVGVGEEAQRVRAIVLTIGRTSEYHRATCRACGALWVGAQQVEKLAADQRDRAADRRDIETLRTSPNGVESEMTIDRVPIPVP